MPRKVMKPRLHRSVFWLVLNLTAAAGAAELPAPAGRRWIEPFDYHGVTLEAGPLKAQVDEVRAFYLGIPDDDLLKGFRTRAGQPAPGKDLGGWYSSDTFLVFGQIVSGLARLYAGTGDPACRDKANRLVAGWARCLEPDGYFYALRKPNAPHYVYDKMVWGLLDDHLHGGNPEALTHLSRITDWAIKNLERSRRINDTSTEWYTLSENLYRAYLATGNPKYREFAEVWEYSETYNTFETQCGCWAAFKLAKYLIAFTGNARYGDWIERLAINGLGATIPMTFDGRVFYYSDYNLGGAEKRNTDFGWSCCTGTRPQAVADYHDLIYFHDRQDLFVNLFTPSTVKWSREEGAVTISQTTLFPEKDEVEVKVSLATPVEFGLHFRVPAWLAGPMRASVNGREVALQVDDKHWATLRRQWTGGDRYLNVAGFEALSDIE